MSTPPATSCTAAPQLLLTTREEAATRLRYKLPLTTSWKASDRAPQLRGGRLGSSRCLPWVLAGKAGSTVLHSKGRDGAWGP